MHPTTSLSALVAETAVFWTTAVVLAWALLCVALIAAVSAVETRWERKDAEAAPARGMFSGLRPRQRR